MRRLRAMRPATCSGWTSGCSAAGLHLDALYFDGRSARGQPVRLQIVAGGLQAVPQGPQDATSTPPLSWPVSQVRWPERSRHGQRVLHLPDGGSLQVFEAAAFDAWCRQHGVAEGWVVRAQQNWRATAVAALAVLVVLVAGAVWGVPWAARTLLVLVPEDVDRSVGAAALRSIEARWLQPSALPPERQARLRADFASAVQASVSSGPLPRYELRFAAADKALGPNAFALPGGTIVLTDSLVQLLQGQDDSVIGVLAHELGHVQQRHGMRALVQLALAGTAASAVLGDFSTLLAGVPALVAQMAYSRDAEREADAEAARVLLASGRSPAAMLVLFQRLPAARGRRDGGDSLPIALASHPLDEERVAFFRAAAQARGAPIAKPPAGRLAITPQPAGPPPATPKEP